MKRVLLSAMPSAYQTAVLSLLASSRFARPSKWRDAVVVTTPERREVIHRLEFAEELRSAGLEDDAHELANEVVRANEIAAYALKDNEDGAGYAAGILVIGGGRR